MTGAEAMPDKVAKTRACKFRNGLLIALLSLTVIRLKNYSSLELGRTLRQVGSQWWIALPATETKGGRADERRIRSLLRSSINRYLEPPSARPRQRQQTFLDRAIWEAPELFDGCKDHYRDHPTNVRHPNLPSSFPCLRCILCGHQSRN